MMYKTTQVGSDYVEYESLITKDLYKALVFLLLG